MSCDKELSDSLRRRGFRLTPQRHAIMHILRASSTHLSPAQVYERARLSVPGITEATVYRTLEFLAENEVLQPALNENRHLVYEITGHDHHHMICNSCGGSIEVEKALLEPLFRKLQTRSGYRLAANHLTFFGLCPNCQDQR